MTGSHQIDVISAIETSNPVGDIRFRDFEVWPIVRLMLDRDRPTQTSSVSLRQRVADVTASLARTVSGRRAERHADAVFLDQRSSRQKGAGGEYFDLFAGPLRDIAGAAGATLTTWDWRDVADARPGSTDATPIDSLLATAVVRAMVGRRRSPARQLRRRLADLAEAVTEHGVRFDPDAAVTRVLTVDALGDVLGARLRAAAPRLGFVMCFYGLPGMGFVLGCRRHGVVSVDIQHGVQGPLHLAYGAWHGEPGSRAALLPDRFWTWTARDAAWIDEVFGTGRAEVGGNLALEATPSADAVDAERYAREILITLQPTAPVPSAVVKVMQACPSDWRWWIRPHPTMTADQARSIVPAGARGRVEVERAAAHRLSTLLDRADAHITAYSSVVLEASSRGVVSFVAPEALDFFGGQIPSRDMEVIASPEALLRGLRDARRHEAEDPMTVRPAAFEHLLAAAAP